MGSLWSMTQQEIAYFLTLEDYLCGIRHQVVRLHFLHYYTVTPFKLPVVAYLPSSLDLINAL